MKLVIQDSQIQNYLKETEIIDFNNAILKGYAEKLVDGIDDNIQRIKTIYEFVRDKIDHSFDIGAKRVTCRASEVFEAKHGVCYAKSHLLAALLRSIGVPTGFCYQGLIFSDVDDRIILHGLVGVFIKEENRWIRLDARGNKPGVNAQFSITDEILAFPVRKELGEFEYDMIYREPCKVVVDCLLRSKDKEELIKNLPGSI